MRGQSSAEFLMTYGWAIFVLILISGLLLSSGAFSADRFISEECSFGPSAPCRIALFNEEGATRIALRVQNSFSYPILIRNLSLGLIGSDEAALFPGDIRIASGAYHEYLSDLPGPYLPEGSLTRLDGYIEYSSCAPEVSDATGCSPSSHVLRGRAVSRVLER